MLIKHINWKKLLFLSPEIAPNFGISNNLKNMCHEKSN